MNSWELLVVRLSEWDGNNAGERGRRKKERVIEWGG
jgi:hypothetical protein